VRKTLSVLLSILILIGMVSGCAGVAPQVIRETVVVTSPPEVIKETVVVTPEMSLQAVEATQAPKVAKYIFLFIGDGLGVAQRNAAELYLASLKGAGRPEESRLLMNTFPAQGMITTYDLTSVIPDSASTATAMSTGFKTASSVVGMDPTGKTPYQNISEILAPKGWKIGILTTVSLDHATPAAFYAHVKSRNQFYDIAMQLVNSGYDFFAGGQMLGAFKRQEGQPNPLEVAMQNGYTIAIGRQALEALKPGVGKVIAMNELVDEDAAMYYSIDQDDSSHVTIAEYTAKAIELLYNPNGFFIIVEGGKIDWACHANDAGASIHDTLALDAAIAEAVKFYEQHPHETLIIVTGDHETGGMSIGYAGTRYASFMDKIQHQTMSYLEFTKKLAEYKATHTPETAKFEDVLPLIEEAFGLYVLPEEEKAALLKAIEAGKAEGATDEAKKAAREAERTLRYSMALTDLELEVLKEAFQNSMLGKEERASDDYTYLLYGGYEPLAVKCTTILNQKAGIGWTSYSHTGTPVQVSALGVGSEQFNGYYDQTEIFSKMLKAAGM
jgi:alkaline phosphatase